MDLTLLFFSPEQHRLRLLANGFPLICLRKNQLSYRQKYLKHLKDQILSSPSYTWQWIRRTLERVKVIYGKVSPLLRFCPPCVPIQGTTYVEAETPRTCGQLHWERLQVTLSSAQKMVALPQGLWKVNELHTLQIIIFMWSNYSIDQVTKWIHLTTFV